MDLEWGDDERCDDLIEDDAINNEEDNNIEMVNDDPNLVSSFDASTS